MLRMTAISGALALVCGLGVQHLLHYSATSSARASTADAVRPDAAAEAIRPVRVVYPGPGATATIPSPAAQPVQGTTSASVVAEARPTEIAAAGPNDPTNANMTIPPATPASDVMPPTDSLDINSASLEALDHIDGAGRIGRAIVRHRPYQSLDDLVRKRVLRRDVLERIRSQLAAN